MVDNDYMQLCFIYLDTFLILKMKGYNVLTQYTCMQDTHPLEVESLLSIFSSRNVHVSVLCG